MNNALTVINGNSNAAAVAPYQDYNREQIDLIKKTVAVGATDAELEFFLYVSRKTGLDPLLRQIHFVKRGDKATHQVSIDGYRLIADRTGLYAGNDEPVFEGLILDKYPAKATVTVWKIVGGQRCGFTASARWAEYAQYDRYGKLSPTWEKMPYVMLAKCAESLALRKAFPADLAALYTDSEMAQVNNAPSYAVNTLTGEVVEAQEASAEETVTVDPMKAAMRVFMTRARECGYELKDAKDAGTLVKGLLEWTGKARPSVQDVERAITLLKPQAEAPTLTEDDPFAEDSGDSDDTAEGELPGMEVPTPANLPAQAVGA